MLRDNSKANRYVSDIELNGKKYTRNYLTHDDLMKGAKN